MNLKSGKEQKKVTTSAVALISKVYTSVSAREPHKMNVLTLGRVSMNTRPSNENAFILGRVLRLGTSLLHTWYNFKSFC